MNNATSPFGHFYLLLRSIELSLSGWNPRFLIAIGAMLFLSACAESLDKVEQSKISESETKQKTISAYGRNATFSYPDFSGQFSVATHSLILIDESREESFDTDSIEKRRLQVRFYYPTNRNSNRINSKKLKVISEDAWRYLVGHQEILGKRLRYGNYQHAKWNIAIDAKIATQQSTFPVLIFSHGYGYNAESYAAMSAELASKGYVVVAINHSYGANPSYLGKNKLVWAEPLNHSDLGEHLSIWSQDQSYLIDQLAIINSNSNSLFHQKLNLSSLGIFGHSYGGAAAYHTAANDPRVKAIIDIDGTIFDYQNQYISQPFAFLVSADHQPKFDFQYATERSYLARLKQFSHSSFSDQVLWWQWDHDDLDLGMGQKEALRAVELTTELIDDFFASHLLDKPSIWFGQSDINTHEVVITRKLPNT